MKGQKTGNRPSGKRDRERRRIVRHSNRVRDQDHVNEMLKLCLQKICELQAEMELEDENTHDPEAEGYTACALETLRVHAQRALTAYLEEMKSILTKEEYKKLLVWTYQGCDLRYKKK